uniref:Uncharacterized protein n=1 Tax=Alexandrium catenella TaxID=2925 RepID=A0A7S1LKK7_ALECA|mmetsp:Transcript_114382/g.304065  ORF Transcript_114382/g.304065 Transcript_114382/m.304065 type:complete len:160 (+) Transcript_114382:3-482(+)
MHVHVQSGRDRRTFISRGTQYVSGLLNSAAHGHSLSRGAAAEPCARDLDVFLSPDSGRGSGSSVYLDAWIKQEDFDFFSTPAGQELLEQRLRTFNIRQDLIDQATESTSCRVFAERLAYEEVPTPQRQEVGPVSRHGEARKETSSPDEGRRDTRRAVEI